MKTKELKEAVKVVSRFTPRRSTLPILESIRLTANGSLALEGTDLDCSCRMVLPYIGKGFDVAVKPKPLAAILAGLSDVSFDILRQDGQDMLALGDAKLPTLDGQEFPACFDGKLDASVIMSGKALRESLRKVRHASSDDETRFVWLGVLVEFDARTFRAVATDGQRMAMTYGSVISGTKANIIIPADTVDKLVAVLPDKTVSLAISKGDRHIMDIRWDNIAIRTKLIDGDYPNWRQVIPERENAHRRVTVHCEQALAALQPLKPVLDRHNSVKLVFGDHIAISAGSVDAGLVTGAIATRNDAGTILPKPGPEYACALNWHFLAAMLKESGQETIQIGYQDELAPLRFDGQEYLEVIMPIRLS